LAIGYEEKDILQAQKVFKTKDHLCLFPNLFLLNFFPKWFVMPPSVGFGLFLFVFFIFVWLIIITSVVFMRSSNLLDPLDFLYHALALCGQL